MAHVVMVYAVGKLVHALGKNINLQREEPAGGGYRSKQRQRAAQQRPVAPGDPVAAP